MEYLKTLHEDMCNDLKKTVGKMLNKSAEDEKKIAEVEMKAEIKARLFRKVQQNCRGTANSAERYLDYVVEFECLSKPVKDAVLSAFQNNPATIPNLGVF